MRSRNGAAWQLAILLGALAIAAAGVLIGIYTAGRAVRPLTELATLVESTPPDRLADALATRTLDREVAALTEQIVASLRAIEAHAVREEQFTRFASHELRTPITVVRGAVELLRASAAAGDPQVLRPVERIERAAADMQAIVEAFLWLARADATAEEAPRVPLAPVVERVASRHRHLLADRPVEVRIDADPTAVIAAPTGVVEVVLGNLIANAFHHTERGSVTVTIVPGAVVVADTGPGIEPALLDQLGRSFVRGAQSVGYGLGLSIVFSLCERFGWTIKLTSSAEAGTRATLAWEPTGPAVEP